ncbi:MAG: hypothetical protein J5517_02565 [Eubacterium sp.]|nr:hypothetical protein [Eubacterium sp.]
MYRIESSTILTPQNGLNIYRGRTHDSVTLTEIRGHDPMDIGIKYDAPELLEGTLRTRRSTCMILMGNLGDPYNDIEKELELTRSCLKIIENNDYGVCISTHQSLILRDMDVLSGIAAKTKCVVDIPIPTLDEIILEKLEGSDTISVGDRLGLVKNLSEKGIDVVVDIYPVIPFVNDSLKDLNSLVKTILEYDIRAIDLRDLRLSISKNTKRFFETAFEERFPEQFKEYMDSGLNESSDITARNDKQMIRDLDKMIKPHKVMYDTRQIKLWRRQYENKTTGKQMTIPFE